MPGNEAYGGLGSQSEQEYSTTPPRDQTTAHPPPAGHRSCMTKI